MGLFSGISKGVKNIFKGAKRMVSDVWKSKLGRAVLIGAAIYVGYGLATQGTAFFGASTAETAAATATSGSTAGASAGASAGAAPAVSAATPTVGSAAGSTAGGAGSNMISSSVGAAPFNATTGITQGDAFLPGMLQQGGNVGASAPGAWAKTAQFVKDNPLTSYGAMTVGGNMISSAMTPNQTDEQLRYDREMRNRGRIAGLANGVNAPVRVGNRTYGGAA